MYSPEKRRSELLEIFESIGEDFIADYPECEFTKDFNIDKIMFNYETLLSLGLKPAFSDEINLSIYKVAAALELVTLHSQPIISSNPNLAHICNVRFSIELAKQFIISKKINSDNDIHLLETMASTTDLENQILLGHEKYLMISSTANSILDYSVLANGLFWEALFCSIFKNN